MRARVQSASMYKSEADRYPKRMGMIVNEVDYEGKLSKERELYRRGRKGEYLVALCGSVWICVALLALRSEP